MIDTEIPDENKIVLDPAIEEYINELVKSEFNVGGDWGENSREKTIEQVRLIAKARIDRGMKPEEVNESLKKDYLGPDEQKSISR